MTRDEFMRELEYLLQDIQDDEKEDALQYYRDYFDEAGPENAEAVVREFGSPERVAAIIRSDLAGSLESGGEFTESGYADERFRDPNYQVAKHCDRPEPGPGSRGDGGKPSGAGSQTPPRTSRVLKIILTVILALVAVPVLWGLGEGALAFGSAVLGLLVALLILVGLLTVIFLFTGALLAPAGIIYMFTEFWNGAAIAGGGLALLGLGLLFLALSLLFYGRFLPFLFRTVSNGLNRLLHR